MIPEGLVVEGSVMADPAHARVSVGHQHADLGPVRVGIPNLEKQGSADLTIGAADIAPRFGLDLTDGPELADLSDKRRESQSWDVFDERKIGRGQEGSCDVESG